jgi:glycosyltransferase involved in cell wall biosynthesis
MEVSMVSELKNNLLIVSHFSPDVGYAWKTISEYFVAIGEMFVERGNRAIICYPEVERAPDKFDSTGIEIVKFDYATTNMSSLYRFLRKNAIRTMYLTDHPTFSFKYLVCRLAGVKKIVVHDRTSGDRDTPRLFKRWAKKIINQSPLMSADVAIAISEFVRQRLIRTSCFPARRTVKIWNGISLKRFRAERDDFVFYQYNIPLDKKIVFAYSRANKYKGIQTLIEGASSLIHEKKRQDLFFLYCGDGPDLQYFRDLIDSYDLGEYFLCAGKSEDIDRILRGVSIVVVPSLWQEGFGLSVVEGMASGKVVIASNVGGIVEIIDDGRNGYLFPAGDRQALTARILRVLDDEDLQKMIGEAARRTVIEKFNIDDKKEELLKLFKIVSFEGSFPRACNAYKPVATKQ